MKMKSKWLVASLLMATCATSSAISELPTETLNITVTKADMPKGVSVPIFAWESDVLRVDRYGGTIFPERNMMAPLTFNQARKAVKRTLKVPALGFLFLERKGRCKISGRAIATYGGVKKPRKVFVNIKCRPAKKVKK